MSLILTSIANHVATLTVNRPEVLNAMNLEVVRQLQAELQKCLQAAEVRVIVITGAGDKAFVAGADIKAMSQMTQKEALEFGIAGQELLNIIETSPKPVIAAVNGFALGGGCEISLACHIRVASENALFAQPEVHLGLIPGWGGTQRLARLVGKGKAIEMITTAEMVMAGEALQIGLVNHVVHKDQLQDKVRKLANSILKNGPQAIQTSLEVIRKGLEMTLEEGLDLEVKAFSELFESEEATTGMQAFLHKQRPGFDKSGI